MKSGPYKRPWAAVTTTPAWPREHSIWQAAGPGAGCAPSGARAPAAQAEAGHRGVEARWEGPSSPGGYLERDKAAWTQGSSRTPGPKFPREARLSSEVSSFPGQALPP